MENRSPDTELLWRASSWQVWVKLLLCAAVLLLLTVIVDWGKVSTTALGADSSSLLLAAALLVLGNVAIAWRWQLLMVPVGIAVHLSQALRSYLKGHFVAHFIPFGLAADVVKAVDLHRIQARSNRANGIELTSSIFMERGFGAITVGIAVIVGLTVSPLVVGDPDLHHALILAAFIVIACSSLALYTDRLLMLVVPQVLLRRWPRLAGLLRRARHSFAIYRREPRLLVAILILSLVIQALRILPVYAIAMAIGADGAFYLYLMAVPVIFLASTIPLVGSRIGTEQGLFVLLLGLGGVAAESALVIALMSLALGMVVALPGGYWLLRDTAPLPQPNP